MASVHRQPGKPHWFCSYSDHAGRRHFVSTKTTDKRQAVIICRTREKAARKIAAGPFNADDARRLITEALEDVMLQAGASLPSSTTSDWLWRWLESKAIDATDSTVTRYKLAVTDFERHLGAKAKQDLGRLSPSDLLDYRNTCTKRLSPGTTNTHLRIVRTALQAAVRAELLERNPAAGIPFAKEIDANRRPFTAEELRRIMVACGDTEWRGLVLCGLYTGQRLQDVAGLTWQQVDLEKRLIRFNTRKTGARLEMHLAKPLADYFVKLPSVDDPADYVFPVAANRTNLSDDFYREVMTTAGLVPPRGKKAKATGKGRRGKRALSAVSFHSLRHNFCTWLKATGAGEAVAQMIVGHESAEVSRRYTHLTAEDSARFIDKLPEVS